MYNKNHISNYNNIERCSLCIGFIWCTFIKLWHDKESPISRIPKICRPALRSFSAWGMTELYIIELPHDKTNKMTVHPAKTPVWSESSLSAWRKLESLATHWAHSEGSDQTGRMPRLIWVFTGRTCHFVGFCHEAAPIFNKDEDPVYEKNVTALPPCMVSN